MKLTIILAIAIVAIVYQVSAQKAKTEAPKKDQKATGAPAKKATDAPKKATSAPTAAPKKEQQKATDAPKKDSKATSAPTGAAKKDDKAKTTTADPTKPKNATFVKKHKNIQAGAHKIYHNCFCEDVVGKKDLVVKNLAGQWFVRNQQSALSFYPFTGDCAYGNITYTDDKNLKLSTESVFHVSKIKAKDTTLSYKGQGVFDWNIQNLTIDTNEVPIKSTLKFAVIDVDYKDYAILYICGNYTIGGPAAEAAPAKTDEKNVPPSSFVFLSRTPEKAYKMKSFNKTISEMYDCYHNMYQATKQDTKTCTPTAKKA